MKKTVIVLCALVLSSGLCFAADKPAMMEKPGMMQDKAKDTMGMVRDAAKVFQGKIKTVKVADSAQGGKSEVTVVDDSGKSMNFMVSSVTTIYDLTLQPLMLDKIKQDDKVLIKYSMNKDNAAEAHSINLLK